MGCRTAEDGDDFAGFPQLRAGLAILQKIPIPCLIAAGAKAQDEFIRAAGPLLVEAQEHLTQNTNDKDLPKLEKSTRKKP